MSHISQSHKKWQIFGLDETGPEQLRQWHKQALSEADLVIADRRFHEMLHPFADTRPLEAWPKPFSELASRLAPYQDKQVAIFTTGDPLIYGAGVSVKRLFPAQDISLWPALSGLQLAAAHMAWPLPQSQIISIHGRGVRKILPHIYPFAKWLVVPQNASSVHEVAGLLVEHGCGEAAMSYLGGLGRKDHEIAIRKTAREWQDSAVETLSDFFILAVDLAPCGRFAHYGRFGALPDEAFISDGKLTKQDARASAISKLQPHPKGVLWDLGTGCGSIAIEWARHDESCVAHGVDNRDDRLDRARANALALGTPEVRWHKDDIIAKMADLPVPDAIFIGGGLSEEAIRAALTHLPAGGRLVCHAVTLESEALLLSAHKNYGGHLVRLTVHKADPVGAYYGWRGLMPVTQWALVKEG
ncbi:MAG: precorrin-6y C5,15-methyltransferase (decarboxylating) subunit CbiE [Candidatus Puniceispirillaceae bacterium]